MKYLYILRHADAAWGTKGLKDHDRILSPAGHEQCLQLADYCAKKGITPDRVLCSTAIRVQQTLRGLTTALDAEWPVFENPMIYQCDSAQLLEEIQLQDDAINSLLIIGHNPTFQEFCWLLSNRGDRSTLKDIEIGFPPATLASVSFDFDHWAQIDKGRGKLTDIFKTK